MNYKIKTSKRLLSIVLVLAMLFAMLPPMQLNAVTEDDVYIAEGCILANEDATTDYVQDEENATESEPDAELIQPLNTFMLTINNYPPGVTPSGQTAGGLRGPGNMTLNPGTFGNSNWEFIGWWQGANPPITGTRATTFAEHPQFLGRGVGPPGGPSLNFAMPNTPTTLTALWGSPAVRFNAGGGVESSIPYTGMVGHVLDVRIIPNALIPHLVGGAQSRPILPGETNIQLSIGTTQQPGFEFLGWSMWGAIFGEHHITIGMSVEEFNRLVVPNRNPNVSYAAPSFAQGPMIVFQIWGGHVVGIPDYPLEIRNYPHIAPPPGQSPSGLFPYDTQWPLMHGSPHPDGLRFLGWWVEGTTPRPNVGAVVAPSNPAIWNHSQFIQAPPGTTTQFRNPQGGATIYALWGNDAGLLGGVVPPLVVTTPSLNIGNVVYGHMDAISITGQVQRFIHETAPATVSNISLQGITQGLTSPWTFTNVNPATLTGNQTASFSIGLPPTNAGNINTQQRLAAGSHSLTTLTLANNISPVVVPPVTVNVVPRQANAPSGTTEANATATASTITINNVANAPTARTAAQHGTNIASTTWNTPVPGAWVTEVRLMQGSTIISNWAPMAPAANRTFAGLAANTTYTVEMRHYATNDNHVTSETTRFNVTTGAGTFLLTMANVPASVSPVSQRAGGNYAPGATVALGNGAGGSGTVTSRSFLGWWIVGSGIGTNPAPMSGNISAHTGSPQFRATAAVNFLMPSGPTTLTAIWGSEDGTIGGENNPIVINAPANGWNMGIIVYGAETAVSRTITFNRHSTTPDPLTGISLSIPVAVQQPPWNITNPPTSLAGSTQGSFTVSIPATTTATINSARLQARTTPHVISGMAINNAVAPATVSDISVTVVPRRTNQPSILTFTSTHDTITVDAIAAPTPAPFTAYPVAARPTVNWNILIADGWRTEIRLMQGVTEVVGWRDASVASNRTFTGIAAGQDFTVEARYFANNTNHYTSDVRTLNVSTTQLYTLSISNQPSDIAPTSQMSGGQFAASTNVPLQSGSAQNMVFLGWWRSGATAVPAPGTVVNTSHEQFLGPATVTLPMPAQSTTLTALWGNGNNLIGGLPVLTVEVRGGSTTGPLLPHATLTATPTRGIRTIAGAPAGSGVFTVTNAAMADVLTANATGFNQATRTLIQADNGMLTIVLSPATPPIGGFTVAVRSGSISGPLIPHAELVPGSGNVTVTPNNDGTFAVSGARALDNLTANATWFSSATHQVLGNEAGTISIVLQPDGNAQEHTLTISNYPANINPQGQSGTATNTLGTAVPLPNVPGANQVLGGATANLNAGTLQQWTFLGWFLQAEAPSTGDTVPVLPPNNTTQFTMPNTNQHRVAVWGNSDRVVGRPNSISPITVQVRNGSIAGPLIPQASLTFNIADPLAAITSNNDGTFLVTGAIAGQGLIASATGFSTNTVTLQGNESGQLVIVLDAIPIGFTVEVRNATGNALIGHATLTGAGTITPVSGTPGSFTVAGALAGQNLSAAATGFASATRAVSGNEAGTIIIELTPIPNAVNFTVHVRNNDTNALINHATLTRAGLPVTSSNGIFTISGATAGQELVASATGFVSVTRAIVGNETGIITILLSPAAGGINISVEVRDSATGSPLIGHSTLSLNGTPVTGSNGTFAISNATVGNELLAAASGFNSRTVALTGAQSSPLVIYLDRNIGYLYFTVQVRSTVTGNPLINHATLMRGGIGVAGSGGVFEVVGATVGQQVTASATGFTPSSMTLVGTERGTTITIYLTPIGGAVNFTVEVRNATGNALIEHAGLSGGAGTITPISGQAGRFTVAGATAGETLAATATGFNQNTRVVLGNEAGTIVITLTPSGLPSFTVEVRCSVRENNPLITQSSLTLAGTAVTGSNGTFTVTGATAGQNLVASALGYNSRTVAISGTESGTIRIYLIPIPAGLNFTVEVRSSVTGNPLIGHATLTRAGNVVIGSGGTFAVMNATAGQDLVASATGFTPRTVTLTGTESGETVQIILEPAAGVINFTVHVRNSETGGLINHAEVTLNGTNVSGSGGIFTVSNATVAQELVTSATGFNPDTRTIVGTESGIVTITLTPAPIASLTVEVRSSRGNNPLIEHAALAGAGTVTPIAGQLGRFTVTGATAGQSLVASAIGFNNRTLAILGEESGTIVIELDPIPNGANFTVRVVNSLTNAPINHAVLTRDGTPIAGNNGMFTVIATAGDVIAASASGFGPDSLTVVGTESGVIEIALVPSEAGINFTVAVRNQAGALIPHAELVVAPERPGAITANGDGTFTVVGVRALDMLNASATWFGPGSHQVLGNEGGTTVVINLTLVDPTFGLTTSNFPQGLLYQGQNGVAYNSVGQPEMFFIPGTRQVLEGADVTITAGTVTDWTFLGWFRIANLPQQLAQVAVPSQNYIEFEMPGYALHYVAVWGDQNGIVGQRNSHQLTINNVPASVEPINQMSSGPRPAQQPVVLASGFAEHWTFLGWWQGANAPTSGNRLALAGNPQFLDNPIVFTMPSAAETLTALWGNNAGDIGIPNNFTLIVTVEGPAAGDAALQHATATFTRVGNVFTSVTPAQLSGSVEASALGFISQTVAIPSYVEGVARLTIILQPFTPPTGRGAIQGQVTRLANVAGAPISGATVILLDTAGNEVSRTETGLTGNYSFNDLQPGTYRLVVALSGFVSQSRDVVVAANTVTTANFALAAGGGDPNDYMLVVNIVNVSSALGSVELNDVAMPYADGVWTLTGPSHVVGEVRAAAVGYLPSAPRLVTVADYAGGRVFVLNITLLPEVTPPVGTIHGFVREHPGRTAPIAGATVTIIHPNGDTSTEVTDALGFFSRSGLGAGTYTVVATANGFIAGAAETPVTISGTGGAQANVYLTRGSHSYSIILTVEPSSAVAAGVTATMLGLSFSHIGGNRWMRTLAAPYIAAVEVRAPGYVDASEWVTGYENRVALVSARLQRIAGEGVLQGYVFEQGTQNRIGNASVTVTNTATGAVQRQEANYDGFFRFEGLAQGSYMVTAWAEGFVIANSPNSPVTLGAGSGVSENVHLARATGPLPDYELLVAVIGPAPGVVVIDMVGVTLERIGTSNIWRAYGNTMMTGVINVDAPMYRATTRIVDASSYDNNGVAFVSIVMEEIDALIRIFPNYIGGDPGFYYEIEMPDINIVIPEALRPTIRRMYGTPGNPGWAFMGWYREVFADMHSVNNPSRITTARRAEAIDLLANLVITEAMLDGNDVLELHGTWVRFGDLNGDGVIDPVDRSLMQNRILGSIGDDHVIMQTANLNPNFDNVVDPVDRSMLQNHILGAPGIILGFIEGF